MRRHIGIRLTYAGILTGSDQERTFGSTISGLIHKHVPPERLLLWDSKQRGGRPDLMNLIKETYSSFGAEGVRILTWVSLC